MSRYSEAHIIARKAMADAINLRRKELKLSKEEIIRRSGVTRQQVYRVLSGKYNYTIDNLLAVLHVLNVHVAFYGMEDENVPNSMGDKPIMN